MNAILTTLLLSLPAGSDTPHPKTRTHTLHSEILLTLHTNNIISEAIKRFGISDKTKDLVVVRFGGGSQEQVWSGIDHVVRGQLAGLGELDKEGVADWKALDKVRVSLTSFISTLRYSGSHDRADIRSTNCQNSTDYH